MGMTYGFLRNYEDRVVKSVNTPDANGNTVLWIGGMEPQIPVVKGDISAEDKAAAIELAMTKATDAKICDNLNSISKTDIGFAKNVYEKFVGDDKMVFVEGCINPKAITVLLRSNSKKYLDEFHRTIKNVYFVLRNFIENPLLVRGAGSTEAIIAQHIRNQAPTIDGREQLVVEKFADSLEEVTITLARNVGMNTIDTITELHTKLASSKEKLDWYGINSKTRKIEKISSENIIETAIVKEQIIKTAVETTNILLNVDDVFKRDEIDNTHCHIDGTVHAHRDGGKSHNHFEQEGIEQRQMHHYH